MARKIEEIDSQVAERFRELRGIDSQAAFSAKLGVSQSIVSEIEGSRIGISSSILSILAKRGVNTNWLLAGDGPMFREKVPGDGEPAPLLGQEYSSRNSTNQDLQKKPDKTLVPLVKSAADMVHEPEVAYYSPKGQMVRPDDLVQVPLLPQKVSAGAGQELIDYTESLGAIPVLRRMLRGRSPAGAYAMEVVGDSMTGERIFGGDIVIFYKGMVEDNGLYILAKDSSLLVKRLTFSFASKKVKISSANERYPEVEEIEDSQALAIIGKVLGWIHVHPY